MHSTLDDMVHYRYPAESIGFSTGSISWSCTQIGECDQVENTTSAVKCKPPWFSNGTRVEGGGGGTAYNGLYREAPPKGGTLFRLEV